jgi:hypothetical protein
MPGVKSFNKVGRPLKFQSVEELQVKIDAYFADCDPHMEERTEWVQARSEDGKLLKDEYGLSYLVEVTHKVVTEQKPYLITGLALALGTSRETLLQYEGEVEDREHPPEFVDAIKKAKLKCQSYNEGRLHTNAPTGAIFSLKNNYGWQDQTEVKHSGSIDRSMSEEDLDAIIDRRQRPAPGQTGAGTQA